MPQPSARVRSRQPLLDVEGVAVYLDTSVRHVRRLVAERRIPHIKVGHFVRFDRDELDAWLHAHRRGPDGGRPAA